MSTTLTALKQRSFRPKYLLFAAMGLMLAYVIPHDESFLVHTKDPMWQHYEPFKWWLLPHGIAGACALLLGPMQFSDRLRNRFTQVHRVVGRIYVAGVFVAAPLGIYIQYFQERMGDPRSFSVAAAVDAALWMITTAIALVFILKGKVQEHRQWMTRSFAVALVFLEASDRRCDRMGESRHPCERNHCLGVPCLLDPLGGPCASVAATEAITLCGSAALASFSGADARSSIGRPWAMGFVAGSIFPVTCRVFTL